MWGEWADNDSAELLQAGAGRVPAVNILSTTGTSASNKYKYNVNKSKTRWSARQEAVKVVHDNLDKFVELFEKLSEQGSTEYRVQLKQRKELTIYCRIFLNFPGLLYFWCNIVCTVDCNL